MEKKTANAIAEVSSGPSSMIRRRPKRSELSVSTNGPMTHLNAHGRYSEPTKAPIAAGPRSCRRICVAIAVAVKPSGMPSVT